MAWVRSLAGGLAGALTFGLAGPALAQPLAPERTEVDLELVLAVDASWSMDAEEQLIQRRGYAAAFRDEDVIAAMTGGYHGRIAVTYFEWASEIAQRQTVPWTLIDSPESAEAFALAIDTAPPGTARGTSISGALRTSAELLRANEYDGLKRVIDISGDGQNISGPYLPPIREAVIGEGVIINGLPLMLRPFEEGDLGAYYEQQVIGGPGSFVIPVYDVSTLASSIRSKLIQEIAGVPAESRHAALADGTSAAD
jgi:hypothetical protein